LAENPSKSRIELLIEGAKALAWPIVALIVLVSFWSPFQETARILPSIIGRSESISIAGLSMRVSGRLRVKATPEVEKVLSRMSRDAVDVLISLQGEAYVLSEAQQSAILRYDELKALGLVEAVPANQLGPKPPYRTVEFAYGVRLTPLGLRTQSFLRSVIAEFVKELPKSQPHPD